MASNLNVIGNLLKTQDLSPELKRLRDLGATLKMNPSQYSELRRSLVDAPDLATQKDILNGFGISESQLRGLPKGGEHAFMTVTVTITVTTVTWPSTAH